jgi:release factor glutamine methyltransferase
MLKKKQMKSRKINLIFNDKKLAVFLNDKVFVPNLTTKMLISEVYNYFKKKKKLSNTALDLGSGSGAIGVSLSKLGIIKKIFMSDISPEAVRNSKYNLEKFKIEGEVKQGKSFYPWKSFKFDLIINDISAISSELVKISPWFKKIPSESGKDGTKLSIYFLKNVKNYSSKKCKIFFPVLSLSNEKKILDFVKKNFKSYKLLTSVSWPLPKSMLKYKKKLDILKKKSYIDFVEIFGKIVVKTHIYLIEI